MRLLVGSVLQWRSVLQIDKTIVGPVSVSMTDLLTGWTGTDEG
jgi:hypothetical protein